MAGNEYSPVRPKTHLVVDGVALRERILAGSPLAVQGIFLEALREYFSDPDAPARWCTDANTDGGILIEAGLNPQLEVNNPSRALYVSRVGTSPSQIMLGNRMGVALPTGQESFAAHMTTSLQFDVVCAARGECELLGDYVHHFLIASRNILAAQYGFHEVSLPTLGAVGPYAADTDYFTVSLSLATTHQFRWTTVKIAPLLQQLTLHTLVRTGIAPDPGSAQALVEAVGDEAYARAAYDSLSRNMPQRPDPTPPERT